MRSRHLIPRGIHLRLVIAISAVSIAAVAVSFVVVHERTAASLRNRIDRELNDQYAELQQHVLQRGRATDPATLAASSGRFVSRQQYHPEAPLLPVSPEGLPPVTNQTRIVDEELSESGSAPGEAGDESSEGIVNTGNGLSTLSTDETGKLRVLTEPIVAGGARIGTFRVADPLTSVD